MAVIAIGLIVAWAALGVVVLVRRKQGKVPCDAYEFIAWMVLWWVPPVVLGSLGLGVWAVIHSIVAGTMFYIAVHVSQKKKLSSREDRSEA